MASKTAIANMALGHVGVGITIANVEVTTERGAEALACRRFYDLARDMALRDFDWPFAMKSRELGLVEEDPNSEWAFAYRYPSDCLKIRRVHSSLRNDHRQSRIPYRIGQDDAGGQLLYTDVEDAEIEYTAASDNAEMYPPDFTLALSLLLASMIAPLVTGGDPFKTGPAALANYRDVVSTAKANATGENQDEEPPESEFVRIRQ